MTRDVSDYPKPEGSTMHKGAPRDTESDWGCTMSNNPDLPPLALFRAMWRWVWS